MGYFFIFFFSEIGPEVQATLKWSPLVPIYGYVKAIVDYHKTSVISDHVITCNIFDLLNQEMKYSKMKRKCHIFRAHCSEKWLILECKFWCSQWHWWKPLHRIKVKKFNPSRAFRNIRLVLIPRFSSTNGWGYRNLPEYDAGLSQVNSLAMLVPINNWVNKSNRGKVSCSRTHATARARTHDPVLTRRVLHNGSPFTYVVTTLLVAAAVKCSNRLKTNRDFFQV